MAKIKHKLYKHHEFDTWDDFIKWNEKLPCSNSACHRRRYQRSKFCASCSHYNMAFGKPHLRRIKRKTYEKEIRQVQDLILFNYGHPLIKDFVDKITQICKDAAAGLPVEYALYFKHMGIVLQRGITGSKREWSSGNKFKRDAFGLLAEWTGFYLFSEKDHWTVIKTERQYYYTLAEIALAGIRSSIKPRPTPKKMRKFGKGLEQLFGIYWIQIAKAIRQHERAEKARKEMLENVTFDVPERTIED